MFKELKSLSVICFLCEGELGRAEDGSPRLKSFSLTCSL
jgi:hypothetical protein